MSEQFKELKKQLLSGRKNGYDRLSAEVLSGMEDYCRGYMAFLDASKTERLCAAEAVRLAEERGYRLWKRGEPVRSGDKLYVRNRGKSLLLAHIGKRPLREGAQMAAAHIDSPRLDLKPNPLYEEGELAFLKTHYYGGLRKYQWVTVPLELRGVIVRRDGVTVPVNLGAEPGDPKLVITDLLPHLGQEQAKKPLSTAIPGEALNLLIGSRPVGDEEDKGRVKLAVMKLLHEKYGITEDDFTSAELEAVPAANACEIGLDRSMIGGYGQDDRVCAYAIFKALLDLPETPEKTAVCILADKEEIGSVGVTGMRSAAFEDFLSDLCEAQQRTANADNSGEAESTANAHHADVFPAGESAESAARNCREHSFCLSADVTAAFDPDYADVYDKRNAAYANYGIGLCKYTGSRGKSGASDADAETVAWARQVFDRAGVVWQVTELGKVDAGGGGTVAAYLADRNIATLDAGVPVLSMHAPFETVAKLDCYETYRGTLAIYQASYPENR